MVCGDDTWPFFYEPDDTVVGIMDVVWGLGPLSHAIRAVPWPNTINDRAASVGNLSLQAGNLGDAGC